MGGPIIIGGSVTVASLIGILVLGESISTAKLLGIALITIGAAILASL